MFAFVKELLSFSYRKRYLEDYQLKCDQLSLKRIQKTREILSAIIQCQEGQREAFDKENFMLKKEVAVCVIPNKEIQMPSSRLSRMRDVFIIAPRGDKFVLASRRLYDVFTTSITLEDERDVKFKLTSKMVMDPVWQKSMYKAVEGIDYMALGFVYLEGIFMAPHHVAYLPVEKEITAKQNQEFFRKFPNFWDTFY